MTTANDQTINSRLSEQKQYLQSILSDIGFPVPAHYFTDSLVSDKPIHVEGSCFTEDEDSRTFCYLQLHWGNTLGFPFDSTLGMGSSATGFIYFTYTPDEEIFYTLRYDARHRGWYLEVVEDISDCPVTITGVCQNLCEQYFDPADAEKVNEPARCSKPKFSFESDCLRRMANEPMSMVDLFRDCFGRALTPSEVKRSCEVFFEAFKLRKLVLENS